MSTSGLSSSPPTGTRCGNEPVTSASPAANRTGIDRAARLVAFVRGLLAAALVAVLLPCPSAAAEPLDGTSVTPPRLAFVEGEASFWRPGAEDWASARPNTPLAAGDALYTGSRSNLEIQIGARAFVRMGEATLLTLSSHEPDFVQFKITEGRAAFDLRSLAADRTIEVDTPNAVLTIERAGYYRVEIAGDTTHFITRRGGRATLTPARAEAQAMAPSEEIVVIGSAAPVVEAYVAPEPDGWDRWNYARSDYHSEAVSSRYLPPDAYGAEVLDHYGNWRQVPSYGPVWVPEGMAPGWVPYSTGSWIWDPLYGWTWVDRAPWGWAPYHYGRWVYLDGYWGWAPGPVVARAVYAPALVAFFGVGQGVSVRIGLGAPATGWVALGWGEPLVPWWGPRGFAGRPWWGGWGGPRIVNDVVVQRTTIVKVDRIAYRNAAVHNAIVAQRNDRFGKGPIPDVRLPAAALAELEPQRGAHWVKPSAASLVPEAGARVRPPAADLSKAVVATRPAHETRSPPVRDGAPAQAAPATPKPVIVPAPPAQRAQARLSRPPAGAAEGPERPRPALPPRFEEMTARRAVPDSGRAAPAPQRAAPSAQVVRPAPPAVAPPAPRVGSPGERRGQEDVAPVRPAPSAVPGQAPREARQSGEARQSREARQPGEARRPREVPPPGELRPPLDVRPAGEARGQETAAAPTARERAGAPEAAKDRAGQRPLPGRSANRQFPRRPQERGEPGR